MNTHWVEDTSTNVLHAIHNTDINIAIYNRDFRPFSKEANILLNDPLEVRSFGETKVLIQIIQHALKEHILIGKDIISLLQLFKKITRANSFQISLKTVNTNMCRRFHTDINKLRLLCTYSGSGTLWLKEDNIDRKALYSFEDNASIVLDKAKIQQVHTGSVVLLKGARYPQKETRAAVHCSPTIEESKGKRLLLKIDTN